ncbi:immunoglobulin A1 protease [Colletotrichum asianum]
MIFGLFFALAQILVPAEASRNTTGSPDFGHFQNSSTLFSQATLTNSSHIQTPSRLLSETTWANSSRTQWASPLITAPSTSTSNVTTGFQSSVSPPVSVSTSSYPRTGPLASSLPSSTKDIISLPQNSSSPLSPHISTESSEYIWTVPWVSTRSSSTDDPGITITQTPTGASFVTLSDFSITTPTIITTTKAGSSNQEIVPVILVKPKKKNPTDPDPIPMPVVCFGCFPGIQFPPKIKVTLKLPDICIQILWFKIGNCPSGEDKKGGGGGGGDGNDDDKPDDEPDDPESTQKDIVNVNVNVFVFVIFFMHHYCNCYSLDGVLLCDPSTLLSTTAQTTCLSSTYTTITGCSVTNAATTVTPTVASTQIPYYPPCARQICGGGVCQIYSPKPSTPNQALPRDKEKRGNPAQGEWLDPDDYSNGYAEFMPAQLREARNRPGGEGFAPKLLQQAPAPDPMVPEPIFNDTDDAAEAIQEWEFFRLPVSTQWITFEDRVASLAIERMVGCHAIVLVSRRGAFVCHFYEDSFFELYSTRTTMTACLRGLPEDSPSRAWHEYGIEDVRDNPEDGKRGVILGNQEGSDGEDDFEDIDAFIITPRERPGYGSFGSGLTFQRIDELIMAPDVNAGRLSGIARQLNRVRQALAELFVDIPIKTIDYPPAMFTCEEWFRRRGTERTLDFSEALRDSIVDTPRGKVLLQYKPAPSCDQEAQVRLFVDVLGHQREKKWRPESDQVFQGSPATGARLRRQACRRPNRNDTNPVGRSASATSHPASLMPPVLSTTSRRNESVPLSTTSLSLNVTTLAPFTANATTAATSKTTSTQFQSSSASSKISSPSSKSFSVMSKSSKTTSKPISSTGTPRHSMTSSAPPTSTNPPATSSGPTTSDGSGITPITKPGVPAPSKFRTSLHRTAVTTARTLDRLPAILPLESVQIYPKEWTSGEGGAVGWIPFWEMFAVPIYSDFNVCKATKVGDEAQSWFRGSEQGEDGRPPIFKADKDIFGKKNCKYKDDGSEEVVGWLSCDGVPEFKCRRSEQLKIECDDMDIKVFRTRVKCVFPVE